MKMLSALVAGLLAATAATPAFATDFSFTGTFVNDASQQYFDFTTTGSTVTLRSYSYAGGVNAAGQTILSGGFDPILSLYDLSTGLRIDTVDDGPLAVPTDPTTGVAYDTHVDLSIAAGTYRVFVTEYQNFGGPTLADGFPYTSPTATSSFCSGGAVAPFCDATGAKRDSHWAFDVLNVDTAVAGPSGVPEPGTWAMMIGGFGLAGAALRRRSTKVAYAA